MERKTGEKRMIKALKGKPDDHILFLDIETAPPWENWEDFEKESPELFECWWDRVKWKLDPLWMTPEGHEADDLERIIENFKDEQVDKNGTMAEFSRVVCVSIGYLDGDDPHVHAESQVDEVYLLSSLKDTLEKRPKASGILCTHSGNGFDIPFLAARMILNGLRLPPQLDVIGVKPWLIPHIDTMDLWPASKFVSMRTLALALGLPDPKAGGSGAQVSELYHAKKYGEIEKYGEGDVLCLINIFRAFRNEPPVSLVSKKKDANK